MRFVRGLAALNILLFAAFAAYSFYAGITKETVFVGVVGTAMFAYFCVAVLIAILQTGKLFLMFYEKDEMWSRSVIWAAAGWIVVIISSTAWSHYVLMKFPQV